MTKKEAELTSKGYVHKALENFKHPKPAKIREHFSKKTASEN
jgi:hypothetical protein